MAILVISASLLLHPILAKITAMHVGGHLYQCLCLWRSNPLTRCTVYSLTYQREYFLIQYWRHFKRFKYFSYCFHFRLFRFVSVDLLFVSVQSKHRNSLFRYRSKTTETPKQTVSKQTEKTEKKTEKTEKKTEKSEKTINFLYKIAKYAPYQTVSVCLLFVSVQSKHRNSLFRYRSETTETNVLFRIVPKQVSVPVSVVSKDTLVLGPLV